MRDCFEMKDARRDGLIEGFLIAFTPPERPPVYPSSAVFFSNRLTQNEWVFIFKYYL